MRIRNSSTIAGLAVVSLCVPPLMTGAFSDEAQSWRGNQQWAPQTAAVDTREAAKQPAPLWPSETAGGPSYGSRIDRIDQYATPGAPDATQEGTAQPFQIEPPAAAQQPAPARQVGPQAPFVLEPEPVEETEAPADAVPAKAAIDLSALKYYASQNDIARVSAEIRRIRSIHPDWRPPAALFEERKATVDEQPMWDLYGEGKLDAIYAKIDEIRAETPDYVPSSELLRKLKIAEARRAIADNAESGAYEGVLTIARQMPDLLVCSEMQVMWHVAESFVATGRPERGFEVYRYILNTCDDEHERLATVQKAFEHLPDAAASQLLALGRTRFDGTHEFETVLVDRLRQRIGSAIEKPFIGGPAPQDLARLETIALNQASIDDAKLLGWYHYSRSNFRGAIEWFDRALTMNFDLKALEGYILAMRNGGNVDEAKAIALKYSAEDYSIAKLFLEIVSTELTDDDPSPLPASDLEVFKTVIESNTSALAAQSLGWYLYSQGEHETARDWFARSVDWELTEEGLLGLAIAESKLGNRSKVKELAATYGEAYPTLMAFREKIGPDPRPARTASRSGGGGGGGGGGGAGNKLMKEALTAYEAGDYDGALNKLDARRAAVGETRDVGVLRGWALHNSGKHKQAYKHFRELDEQRSTKETRQGAMHAWRKMMPPRFH